MRDNKVHQGQITISKTDVARESATVYIQIEDKKSGTQFLQVRMPLLAFAQAAIGNMGYVECEFELYADRVGMVQERREEVVMIPRDIGYPGEDTKTERDIAIAVHEVDGWVGSRRDAGNHHRSVPEQDTDTHFAWRVGYYRFVEDNG